MQERAHIPVLAEKVSQLLRPPGKKVLLDCTIGDGGHAARLLGEADPDAHLIGIDVDPISLQRAAEALSRFPGRFRLFQARFSEVRRVLREAGFAAADLLIADLGLASHQLDDASRGFSFSVDGPLDMRMGPGKTTAADIVNRTAERELADLIYRYGQERYSRRIARAIVRARGESPVRRTRRLAEIVAAAMPPATRKTRRGVHPATRTFQALRIATNRELDELEALLGALEEILAIGGRAGIISFHSLEDRRVKQAFAALTRTGSMKLLTRKPMRPDEREVAENSRSRSARFRAIERIAA